MIVQLFFIHIRSFERKHRNLCFNLRFFINIVVKHKLRSNDELLCQLLFGVLFAIELQTNGSTFLYGFILKAHVIISTTCLSTKVMNWFVYVRCLGDSSFIAKTVDRISSFATMHIIFTVFIHCCSIIFTKSIEVPGNLTDVSICKLSHLGIDYTGTIGNSESGVRCQSWTAKNPIHSVDLKYTDDTFSDFSKTRAKNYCRNPSRDAAGPWCYTMAPDNINETCGIPLCAFSECRTSGPGMEYSGHMKSTVSGKYTRR